MSEVSIVIPTYHHLESLKTCCASLLQHTNLSKVKIVVVANGCYNYGESDGTKEYVESLGDPFILLDYPAALGYTKATNIGIQYALDNLNSDVVVLLNNDTQATGDWLTILLSRFNETNVGVAGPIKLYNDIIDDTFIIFFCVAIKRKVFEETAIYEEM